MNSTFETDQSSEPGIVGTVVANGHENLLIPESELSAVDRIMDTTLAERIVEVRKHLRLTQTEFAKATNVSRGAVGQWETGASKPSDVHLVIMARLARCGIDWLRDGVGSPVFGPERAASSQRQTAQAPGAHSNPDADDGGPGGFDWTGDDSVVLGEQLAVACYINTRGNVVIRQERGWDEQDDTIIVVRPENLGHLIGALQRLEREAG